MEIISQVYFFFVHLLGSMDSPSHFVFIFFPIVLIIELPIYIVIVLGVLHYYFTQAHHSKVKVPYYPKVSCIVTCYNEGKDILKTIRSLEEQLYNGVVEILVIIDGAKENKETLEVALQYKAKFKTSLKRIYKVIPKWLRGGHASSLNLGVKLSTGEIILCLDGDCSCDNDMISNMASGFIDAHVIASSGALRVRNYKTNLLTKLQCLEYFLGIYLSRTALSAVNSINNLSSAFSAFRKSFLVKTSLWHNGSAEDLDMTLRLQSYFHQNKQLKIIHMSSSVVHTDAPETIKALFKQRMRWDGDIYYIYIRRHRKRLRPRYLGWKTFIMTIWSGLLMHAVLPILIVLGIVYMFILYELGFVLLILVVTYWYYLIVNCFMFLLFMIFVSDRKKEDGKLIPILFVLPIYTMAIKFVSSIALIVELCIKSHKDSTMAPAWVNKKVQ